MLHFMASEGLAAASASRRQSTLPLACLGLQVSGSKLRPGQRPEGGTAAVHSKAARQIIVALLHLQERQCPFNKSVKGLQQPHRSYSLLRTSLSCLHLQVLESHRRCGDWVEARD